MNFFTKYKNIIIIVIVIIAAFFLYSTFFQGDREGTSLLTSRSNIGSSSEILGADIIRAINQIDSLDLDKSIFTDPVFQSLIDRSEPIDPEPTGRFNPFAPIGTGGSVSSTVEETTEEVNEE